MARKIKLRTDLHNVWEDVNPVLGEGELGVVKDKNTVKVGDGNTNFNDLPELAKDPEVVHKTGNEIIDGVKTFNERIYINTANIFQVWTETDTAVDNGGLRRFVNDGGVFRIDRNTATAGNFSTYKKDFIIDNDGDIKINKNIVGNGMGEVGGTNTFGSQLRGTYIAPPLYGEWSIKDNSTFYNVGDILAYGIDKGELEVTIKDKDGNDITPSNIRDVFRDDGYIIIDNVSDISPLTVEIKRINGSNIGSIRELILLYAFRDSYIKTGKVEVEQDGNNDGTYDWDTVLNINNAERLNSQVIPVATERIRTIKITVNEVGSQNKLRLRNIIGIRFGESTNSYWLSRDGGSVYGNVGIGTDNHQNKLTVDGGTNGNVVRIKATGNTHGPTILLDSTDVHAQDSGIQAIDKEGNNTCLLQFANDYKQIRICDISSGYTPNIYMRWDTGDIATEGDIETTTSGKGVILKNPNGDRYRVTVNNDGNLTTTKL